jgi:hypothetical protein
MSHCDGLSAFGLLEYLHWQYLQNEAAAVVVINNVYSASQLSVHKFSLSNLVRIPYKGVGDFRYTPEPRFAAKYRLDRHVSAP